MEQNIKKYPKSVHGQQCIGPCHPKNTLTNHPVTLEFYAHDAPFCFTNEWYANNKRMIADECFIPQQTEEDIVTIPTFVFNCKNFLSKYYGINSLEEGLFFINEKTQPLGTNLRIAECLFKAYWDIIQTPEDLLIDFYMNVIKNKWIYDIYKANKKNKIDKTNKKQKSAKMEFIKKNITKQDLYKILDKHLSTKEDIGQHNDNIKKITLEYFNNKIQNLNI